MAIDATYSDDLYTFTGGPAHAELTRFSGKTDTITCEVRIVWRQDPVRTVHGPARWNLLADRTLSGIARACAEQTSWEPDVWVRFLTEIREAAINRYREGDPLIPLAEIEATKHRWLLPPILEHGGVTILAAPGGSFKSLIGLSAAVAVAGGTSRAFESGPRNRYGVAYLDWEADHGTFAARARALGEELPANIYYRREVLPLVQTADELARSFAKRNIGMVVIDSKGVAAGGSVKEDDAVLGLFAAIRRLGVESALVLDHVTKRAMTGRDTATPFGSVYAINAARMVWVGSQPVSLHDGMRVVYKLTKANNMRVGKRIAWDVTFDEEDGNWRHVSVRPADPDAVVDVDSFTDADRLAALIVAEGPMTTAAAADRLGKSDSSVRAMVSRYKDRFERMSDHRIVVLDPDDLPDAF